VRIWLYRFYSCFSIENFTKQFTGENLLFELPSYAYVIEQQESPCPLFRDERELSCPAFQFREQYWRIIILPVRYLSTPSYCMQDNNYHCCNSTYYNMRPPVAPNAVSRRSVGSFGFFHAVLYQFSFLSALQFNI